MARLWAKENLKSYLDDLDFGPDTFRLAAEQNADILPVLFGIIGADSGNRHHAWFDALADADFLLRLMDEVSPEHAGVLRSFPMWYNKQIETIRRKGYGEHVHCSEKGPINPSG